MSFRLLFPRVEKKWLIAIAVLWAIGMVAIVGTGIAVQRRAVSVLQWIVQSDPNDWTRAPRSRLEADRLVIEALHRRERAAALAPATTTASAAAAPEQTLPLLEKAERLYLDSLDARTSQPGLLFYVAELNFLMGRIKNGNQWIVRYWEALGETPLADSWRTP
jgi:hypothetical protein